MPAEMLIRRQVWLPVKMCNSRLHKIGMILLLGLSASQAVLAASGPVVSIQDIRTRHVVLQQWELSCAAAALATVLRYQYGLPVTERGVALGLINRPEYFANPNLVRQRQGFSLLDMKRYTARLGYQGVGLGQLSFGDLLHRAPVILPINAMGYPHFVVFRGATTHSVLLADPAFGNVTMSRDKFIHSWINYQNIGHVGFIVTRYGKASAPGLLQADISEFPFTN